jgi:CBS domain containing-hemolysin-like protein
MTIRAMCVACIIAASSVYSADEITTTVSLDVRKGYLVVSEQVSGLKVTMTGDAASSVVQVIGTNTAELVAVGSDVGTKGMAFFRALTTATNAWVDVGGLDSATNFIPFLRLYAGQVALGPIGPSNVYALAYGDAVALKATVVEK